MDKGQSAEAKEHRLLGRREMIVSDPIEVPSAEDDQSFAATVAASLAREARCRAGMVPVMRNRQWGRPVETLSWPMAKTES